MPLLSTPDPLIFDRAARLPASTVLWISAVVCSAFVLLLTYRKRTSARLPLPPSPPKHWFWGNKSFLNRPYRHVLLGTECKQQLGGFIY
jgi:hypothetical protein